MLRKTIARARFLASISALAIFLVATAMVLYGAYETYHLLAAIVHGEESEKELILNAIELVDLFLLSIVLLITAFGLYALFVDDTLPLPSWLEIHTLDDLKAKLISAVIVVLGVLFLGQVIAWDGQRDLLGFGAAIALVIGALTYFLSQTLKKAKPADEGE